MRRLGGIYETQQIQPSCISRSTLWFVLWDFGNVGLIRLLCPGERFWWGGTQPTMARSQPTNPPLHLRFVQVQTMQLKRPTRLPFLVSASTNLGNTEPTIDSSSSSPLSSTLTNTGACNSGVSPNHFSRACQALT